MDHRSADCPYISPDHGPQERFRRVMQFRPTEHVWLSDPDAARRVVAKHRADTRPAAERVALASEKLAEAERERKELGEKILALRKQAAEAEANIRLGTEPEANAKRLQEARDDPDGNTREQRQHLAGIITALKATEVEALREYGILCLARAEAEHNVDVLELTAMQAQLDELVADFRRRADAMHRAYQTIMHNSAYRQRVQTGNAADLRSILLAPALQEASGDEG